MTKHRDKSKAVVVANQMKPADDSLVSLRIDRHTVILVTPDKATPEYAQQWREKHEKAGKREATWNSKTSFE